ncbi:hypothetical protein [Streptomyces sp. NPDC056647]|uniref:hypothetical protein n=1 Tax=Streptomyces sp. NPDC056647 TaxID=3345890 RepID=UPI0036B2B97F
MRRSIRAVAPLMLALATAFTLAPAAAAEDTPPPVAVPGDFGRGATPADLGWGSTPADIPAAVQGDLGWG